MVEDHASVLCPLGAYRVRIFPTRRARFAILMHMQTKATWALVGALFIAAIVGIVYIFHTLTTPLTSAAQPVIDYKNLTYQIDGRAIKLTDGYASVPAAPNATAALVTQYYGNEFTKDLNGDGTADTVFIVTQSGSGSGTFYYVVAAVSAATSTLGSHAYLLGDRIVPQSITSGPGAVVVVTYTDRRPSDPFTAQPTVTKQVTLRLDPTTLAWQVVGGAATSTATTSATTPTTVAAGQATSSATTTAGLDLQAIPLGDGNISSGPEVGYVYSCTTNFRTGGASHSGDWINGSTWNRSLKPSVAGNVLWPNATFSTYLEGNQRLLQGNGLPVNAPTGNFPIARTDPAYQYDHNPNTIQPYTVSVLLPKNPTFAASPSCVPMGPIGYALDGVAIYNALDDGGRDAVAHEIQDKCDGHPQSAGEYHYHGPSPCMPNAKSPNALVGYALDGYGIYSQYKADGTQYTNADLDACHGTTSPVLWNGTIQTIYHYVMTAEYPYTVGCFRGTPVRVQPAATSGATPAAASRTSATGSGATPPPAAIAACANTSTGASCSFTVPKGTVRGTCRQPRGQTALACVP